MMQAGRSPRIDRMLAWAGILGPIVFVTIFTVAGWLRPGYSAMEEAVSDLGVGPQAWIQNTNFFLFGALLLLFAIGFARIMQNLIGSRPAVIGAVLIAATGTGIVAAGIFPAEPPTEWLHFLLGFFFSSGSAIATSFYVGRKLRDVPGWESLARYSLWTGIGAVGLVVLSFVALNPASPLAEAGIGGLIERALVIEIFAWHTVTGLKLVKSSTATQTSIGTHPQALPFEETR